MKIMEELLSWKAFYNHMNHYFFSNTVSKTISIEYLNPLPDNKILHLPKSN